MGIATFHKNTCRFWYVNYTSIKMFKKYQLTTKFCFQIRNTFILARIAYSLWHFPTTRLCTETIVMILGSYSFMFFWLITVKKKVYKSTLSKCSAVKKKIMSTLIYECNCRTSFTVKFKLNWSRSHWVSMLRLREPDSHLR